MYKTVIILYLVCGACYVLFTRVPDYFEGDFIHGVVTEATFSNNQPHLSINYNVGSQIFLYRTSMWFLTSYKAGDIVTIIYNPSNPSESSIYAIIGYWIKWPELFISAIFFIVLFVGAVFITGKNQMNAKSDDSLKKRKYKD